MNILHLMMNRWARQLIVYVLIKKNQQQKIIRVIVDYLL